MTDCNAEDLQFLLASQLAPIYFRLLERGRQCNQNNPDFVSDVGLASRQYLQVMKEVEDITNVDSLKVLIEIWELLELMILDSKIRGATFGKMLEDLLNWSFKNNTVTNELELKAIQSEGIVSYYMSHKFRNYFMSFYPLVLTRLI